ncbi:hypothetical protein [Herbaspirillum rhizosphaerae]|uniref:hypothetical protein n=1 Tax=Herbaspirillum rhizosphaerae TaxID=346179 RepID=UPI00067B783E|nr:hypothetical protein [Herbaspirillum rhizosphaerae]
MESNSPDASAGAGKDLSCVDLKTKIATPRGHKDLAKLRIGDEVMTASVIRGGGTLALQWSPSRVALIDGIPLDLAAPLVLIWADAAFLLCSPDQHLLLANGEWIRADQLRIGMQLASEDGASRDVRSVNLEHSRRSASNMVTANLEWDGNPDGHILLANGFVIGDLMMQLHRDVLPG